MSNSQGRPAPRGVITLPVQRDPTYDGTSGLHYSGRTYANQFNAVSTDICQGTAVSPDKINDVMQGGISTTNLGVDANTKRINRDQLKSYIDSQISAGKIPGKKSAFQEQLAVDAAFYNAVQKEYCFYETRYQAALKMFVDQVASASAGADMGGTLNSTIALNTRLNSLLEIINYVGNRRADFVNDRAPQISEANADLQTKIAKLNEQKAFLSKSDVRTRTQEEMVRYSAEKSRAMNIQIMFFVALNVVALGTIITVYKTLRPSV